jgi:cyclophilin family peptidyl-prolyl cis-trans isomerase
MAKRRKARPFLAPESQRAVGSVSPAQRRKPPRRQPPPHRSNTPLLVGGAVAAVAVLAVLAVVLGWIPGVGPGAGASPTPSQRPIASRGSGPFEPPTATPLASPPAEPASSGTTVTIGTQFGDIVIQLFDQSSPVAAQNFTNLAAAGFYNGLIFHRIVPRFVIQGGDPNGDGTGGPGYTIPDEPVVGQYSRGIVAMARASAPNSQGSQFFIVLDDEASYALGSVNTYAIFGKVISDMGVVDAIAAVPLGGAGGEAPLTPVIMTEVTVQRP